MGCLYISINVELLWSFPLIVPMALDVVEYKTEGL